MPARRRAASTAAATTATARPSKGETTRRHVLDTALSLFRERGFDETTMRDIAAEAGLSLGAAYHYFPSKEALAFAYYERSQQEHDARAREELEHVGDVRARLAAVAHSKLDLVRRDRRLLGALFRFSGRPGDALSVFAKETRPIRERAIALFDEALGDAVPGDLRRLVSVLLWLGLLGALLYFIHDRSPKQQRTRRLVDGALDVLVPSLPLLAVAPPALRHRVTKLLEEAGLLEA
jgi:AcrR family transcriptional regulator